MQEVLGSGDVAGFQITMPEDWWELPLESENQEDHIGRVRAVVDERKPDVTDDRRARLVSTLADLATAARRSGAMLCAQGAMADGDGRLVAASVVVTPVPAHLPAGDLEKQAAQMGRRGFPGRADPRPAECSVVTLPQAGPAIRLRSEPGTSPCDSPAIGVDSLRLQFFVPVPGTAGAAVVTFSFPVVGGGEARDQLVELFDAMARTFCFVDARGEPLAPSPEG